jgi:hypothetical protein
VFARIITELGGIPPRVPVAGGQDSSAFGEAADISQLPEVAALRQLVTGRGSHSSPFPLNLSLLCPFSLNLSLYAAHLTQANPWTCPEGVQVEL